jgi:hypothetical protein
MSRMSELDMDRQLLDAVSAAMEEPVLSAEEQIERKVDWIVRELDELTAMACNSETVDLIEAQRVAVGQIIVRAQLIGAFLMSRQPHLKVVHRAS